MTAHWPGLKKKSPMQGLGFNMILKIVFLFLIGMVVLAMFGRLRLPGQKSLESRRCQSCGRFRIGRSECNCREN